MQAQAVATAEYNEPPLKRVEVYPGRYQNDRFANVTRFYFRFNSGAQAIYNRILPKYSEILNSATGKLKAHSMTLFVPVGQERVVAQVKAFIEECFSPKNPRNWDQNWLDSGVGYDRYAGFCAVPAMAFTNEQWSKGMGDAIAPQLEYIKNHPFPEERIFQPVTVAVSQSKGNVMFDVACKFLIWTKIQAYRLTLFALQPILNCRRPPT